MVVVVLLLRSMLRIGKGLVGKVGGCWGVRYSSLMHNSKLDVEERCSQDRKTKVRNNKKKKK